MKLAVTISDFPLPLLDSMKQRLEKVAPCDILQSGSEVSVTCNAEMVKCMEVIAVVDKYNCKIDENDFDLFAPVKPSSP